MNNPLKKKLFPRIFTFGLATLLIVGMIPAGTAFFWSKKDTSAEADKVLTEAAIAKSDNMAPVAQNLTYETYCNITVAGKLKAIDPEGDTVTFQIVQKPSLGEVAIEGTSFRYVPYQNKSGSDFFTYAAVDVKGNTSSPARVDINLKKRNLKASVTYADLDGHPAHYAAIRLAEEGIIVGEKIGASYFLEPAREVTRSEFVAMAVTAAGLDIPAAAINTGFEDDDTTEAWAKPYISAAVTAGFVSGRVDLNGNVSFRGSSPITRAEAAVIINKLAALSDESEEVFFKDVSEIPAWAVQATINVDAVNIMNGYSDGTIRPNAVLTRSEAVQILYNSLRIKESSKDPSFVFWVK